SDLSPTRWGRGALLARPFSFTRCPASLTSPPPCGGKVGERGFASRCRVRGYPVSGSNRYGEALTRHRRRVGVAGTLGRVTRRPREDGMASPKVEYRRPGFVSVWVGEFPTPDAADAYFTEEYDR